MDRERDSLSGARAPSAGVRWRSVLAAGSAAGVVPQLLLFPIIFGYVLAYSLLVGEVPTDEQSVWFGNALGVWGLPVMQALLALFAASWMARSAGTATTAVTHGVLVALVSVVVGQLAGLPYGPLDAGEITRYLVLSLASGLLGGLEARAALFGREALHGASRLIGAARGPQDVANAIGDTPLSAEANGAALWWSDFPAEGGAALAANGSPAASPWFLRGWPEGVGLDGDGVDVRALAGSGRGSSRTLRPEELLAEGRRAAWRKKGVRSVLLLPLVAPAGRKIGLLAVACRRRRFSRGAARSYETISAQTALALENLRLVEEARKAGREAGVLRERQRMAHEIHDTLAQGFTSVVANLRAARRVRTEAGVSDPTEARQHTDQAELTARESLTEARRLVWALRPEALEKASLSEALGELSRRWTRESGVACGVSTTGEERPLPEEVEGTLYRVAQEALNNARKHAGGASRVALTLSYMEDAVALDARDDGPGFDPAEVEKRRKDGASGGFGLKGMRERVEGAGGTLAVESAPGEGTTLAVELPVAPTGCSRAAEPAAARAEDPRA